MKSATPIRPRAVIFDLGKVLLDFNYQIAARTLSPHSRLSPVEFKRVLDQSPLLLRYESGGMSTGEFESEVRAQTGFAGTTEQFRSAFGDIFAEIPEMVRLQAGLSQRGIPTYIFSNTNEIAVQHIRSQFPFFGGFNGLVLSYEIRASKPDEASYVAVERHTGLTGPELLYVDDRAENVAGGLARGWQALLHEDPAATIPEVLRRVGI